VHRRVKDLTREVEAARVVPRATPFLSLPAAFIRGLGRKRLAGMKRLVAKVT